MTSLKRSLLITTAFLSFLQFSQADPPNGAVGFSFNTETATVWDLTGSIGFQQTIIGAGGAEIPLGFGIDLTQDDRGFLSGSGFTVVNVGNDFVGASYIVRGKISGGGDNTRVTLNIRLNGEDFVTGVNTRFGINLVYTLRVDAASGTLQGVARGSAKFSGLGSGKILSDVTASLPASSGTWTLQMNILPLSHLVGNAQIILPNGRILQARLAGAYSPGLDRSTVRVSGIGINRGNAVLLTFDTEVLQLQGRVLGQVVTEVSTEPETP